MVLKKEKKYVENKNFAAAVLLPASKCNAESLPGY